MSRIPKIGDLVLYLDSNGKHVPAIVNLLYDDDGIGLVVFAEYTDYRPARVYEGPGTYQWQWPDAE